MELYDEGVYDYEAIDLDGLLDTEEVESLREEFSPESFLNDYGSALELATQYFSDQLTESEFVIEEAQKVKELMSSDPNYMHLSVFDAAAKRFEEVVAPGLAQMVSSRANGAEDSKYDLRINPLYVGMIDIDEPVLERILSKDVVLQNIYWIQVANEVGYINYK